jgi:uncharacterized membrane protein
MKLRLFQLDSIRCLFQMKIKCHLIAISMSLFSYPFSLCFCCYSNALWNNSALTTFRKETEDGDELELHGAEVAFLMNLVATDSTSEEAVALIPSLSRFPEAAIDEILDLIRSTIIRIVS